MSLDGLVVGVPAARRANETIALIERWGGTALAGPTVEEVPVEDEGPVLEATRAILDRPPDWAIHLTGAGTRLWFEAAGRGGLLEPLLDVLSEVALIPRGSKANGVLRSFGLEAAWVPEGETSKEIAGWLVPQLQAGRAVVLQRHGEPVPTLTTPLKEAGATVVDVVTYRWQLPAGLGPAERLVEALAAGGVHALVVTSAPQIRGLLEVAAGMGVAGALREALAGRVYIAAVGTVAASAIEEQGLATDLIAEPPRLGALIRELAAEREGILRKNG